MRGWSFVAVHLVATALSASIIPQSGFSGRPGDGTCRDCHPAVRLVAADSSVILGLPDTLQPETVYPCTLVIRYKGLNLWTFELTAVDSNSVQAGAILVVDSANTQMDCFDSIQYFKNTLKGAYVGKPDSARWAFEYLSPSAGTGPVSFYWCAFIRNRKKPDYHIIENRITVPEDCPKEEDESRESNR